ncbi:condensation domain-containing protein [Streptomyces tendae]|uniref:condensation domain-containing protein n=1 Tax=Streptomyces tendae TaxID=1932 RepID=UPI0024906765|nr:condensation domain-containing protein [Streptomyces tendae]
MPVSDQQRSLWFLETAGAPGAYNVTSSFLLRGRLNVPALLRSLQGVARRHEALRTVLVAGPDTDAGGAGDAGEQVLQRVLTPEEFAPLLFPESWDGDPDAPFRLHGGPLFRARVRRVSDEEHLLHVGFHHAVFDDVSSGVFWQELWQLYAGAEPPAPELSYADYAVWQRERADSGILREQTQWWARRLTGAPALCSLPTDRPRPSRSSGRGRELRIRLDRDTLRRLEELARSENASVYMVLTAGLQALVALWSGMRDVLIGSPVSGRLRTELSSVIGYFVNTVVLRAHLTPELPFIEHLRRTRQEVLDVLDHQEVTFDRVVQAVNPARSAGSSPLFQILYSHLGEARTGELPHGLTAEDLSEPSGTAKFDVTVMSWEDTDGLVVSFEYATDLFEESTVERFGREFTALLNAVADAPERPIAGLGVRSLPQPVDAHRAAVVRERPAAEEGPQPEAEKGGEAARDATGSPQWTAVESFLGEAWCSLLGRDEAGRTDDFFALGGNSFLGMRLLARIRRAYGVDLPVAALFEAPTVERLAVAVGRSLDLAAVQAPIKLADGRGPALILVHPVGGGVSCYLPIARALSRPVFALEAAGLESVEAMAAAYLDAIGAAGHQEPFALGGWSMGGVIAFEMARLRQRETGHAPPVVLIDSHVALSESEYLAEGDLVSWFADDWGKSLGRDLGTGIRTVEALLSRAHEHGILDRDQDRPAVERLLSRFAVNARAYERFRMPPGHRGRVQLLAAAGEPRTAPDQGWGAMVEGALDVRLVPGDHHGVMTAPSLPGLIDGFLKENGSNE